MLSALLSFLLVLIALLAVPVTLRFQLSHRQALQGRIRLEWLFGLVHIHIPVGQHKPAVSPSPARPPSRAPKRSANPLTLIRYRPFRRRILRFLSDLWRALSMRDLTVRLRIGLGDPADTGQLWAMLGPVAAGLAQVDGLRVELEPEFLDAAFELESRGCLRLIPLQLIYLTLALLLSPALWRGLGKAHRG